MAQMVYTPLRKGWVMLRDVPVGTPFQLEEGTCAVATGEQYPNANVYGLGGVPQNVGPLLDVMYLPGGKEAGPMLPPTTPVLPLDLDDLLRTLLDLREDARTDARYLQGQVEGREQGWLDAARLFEEARDGWLKQYERSRGLMSAPREQDWLDFMNALRRLADAVRDGKGQGARQCDIDMAVEAARQQERAACAALAREQGKRVRVARQVLELGRRVTGVPPHTGDDDIDLAETIAHHIEARAVQQDKGAGG